jgi:hypothetical protein
MIIYEFTHIPTGKAYIGSKKSNDAYYAGYNSSSAVVSEMMNKAPDEWSRAELCVIDEDAEWDFTRVVNLEQRLIKRRVDKVGWDGVWNGSYHMSGNFFSPASLEKKRQSLIGRTQTESERKAKSIAAHKRYESQEERDKSSAASKGKPKSESHRKAFKEAIKALAPVTCSHCGLTGGKQGMNRYHFDKCKMKDKQ